MMHQLFLLLLIAPKQKNFCVTKDRVPLRGLAEAGPRIVICEDEKMNESPLRLSLLEYMAYRAGCVYLSGLHTLDRWQKCKLRREVEQLEPEDASLHEWNDALAYLTGQPSEANAETAREKILSYLAE